MVKNKKLKMVLLYLITELNNRNYSYSRLKLIKLLFIADYIAKNGNKIKIGKTITGITYKYYTNGAFSEKIIDALNEMNYNEIIVTEQNNIKLTDLPRFKIMLDNKEKKIINFVVREYGDLCLSSILDIVYKIPEMEHTKPLEVILR